MLNLFLYFITANEPARFAVKPAGAVPQDDFTRF
jgi:hypothetical protein